MEVSAGALTGATAAAVCRLGRMPAAGLPAPPSHSKAFPPVPQPQHSPDRPSIPETVLEFWRCLQGRPERGSCPAPGEASGRAEGSLQACPWELENSRTYTSVTRRSDDILGEEAGPPWVHLP